MHGVKLVTARVKSGLSIRRLAELSKINSQSIYKLENGLTTRPHPATIVALSKALNVEPEAIDEFRPALGLPATPAAPATE